VECGFLKTDLHYTKCHLHQTTAIINKIRVLLETHSNLSNSIREESAKVMKMERITWEQFTDFSDLRKKGLDQIGIDWINFYLKQFNIKNDGISTSEKEQQIILDGILGVLYCYNTNSGFVYVPEKRCPACKHQTEKCIKMRKRGFEITKRNLAEMDYPNIAEFNKMSIVVFPHLIIRVFTQLFEQLNQRMVRGGTADDEIIHMALIFSWATCLIKEYLTSKLLAEVDREVRGQ